VAADVSGVARRAALLVAGTAAVAGLLWALPQPGTPRGPPPAPGFVVEAVRVFDGLQVLEATRVVVEAGRITAVGPEAVAPAGLERVDGRGLTLLPGLIDAHVHAWGSALADALNFGVTTVLDMHGDPAMLRELGPSRESLSPRAHADLFGAGWMATVPGGHGTQFGLPVPTLSSPDEAETWLQARFAEGADWLKLAYEPTESDGGGPPFPSLDLPTARALVEGAHRRGRLAMGHVSRLASARELVEAGVDGLVHAPSDVPADEAFARQVAARRAFVVPTLAVVASFGGAAEDRPEDDAELGPFLAPFQRASLGWRARAPGLAFRLDAALRTVRLLRAAGADLLAGSDAPNPGTAQGASLHVELALLVRAGLTPLEALAAATSVPARRFGLGDRGRIGPGARADLLLVRGDPTRDILATRAIARIWKNGAPVERRRYPPPEARASDVPSPRP
jgi:imidazolonepropionase-like amidohydrolase